MRFFAKPKNSIHAPTYSIKSAAAVLVLWVLLPVSALSAEPASHCPPPKPRPASPPLITDKQSDATIHIRADELTLQGDALHVFSGNVELHYRDYRISADKIVYDKSKDEFDASGNVSLRNPSGDSFTTSHMHLRGEADTGYTDQVVFSLSTAGARGDASAIVFEGRQHSQLKNARYTTCAPGQDDWFIITRDLTLNYAEDTGVARNAVIKFKGVPIFYWPYLSFPISGQRRSGFLVPRLGDTNNSGFFLATPYYWNIAPDLDATITPRVLTRRGLQWQNEMRYLDPSYDGIANVEFLVDDDIYGKDRSAASLRHSQYFDPYWQGNIDVQAVSDKDYLNDFGKSIAVSSQTHLPRKASVDYGDEIWKFSARAFGYQTVDKTIPPLDRPYNRLPQLLLSGEYPQGPGQPHYRLESELVSFARDAGTTGTRVDFYPNVSLPWRNSYAFFVPKAGVRYTRYELSDFPLDRASRSIGVFSLDTGLLFDRVTDNAYIQTFEPRLFYVYIPYRYQDDLPNFDTGEPDFIFSNLFRENRFIGGDRVGDANQATFALTSRLMDDRGVERLRASLGQIFYFDPRRVNLTPSTQDAETSNFAAEARALLASNWYARGGLQWNPDQEQTEKGSLYVQYQPAKDRIVSLGHRRIKNVQEQADFSTQWPVASRWALLAHTSYSLIDERSLESYLGFQYNACCWATRVFSHRRLNQNQEEVSSVMIEFELNGLSKFGDMPTTPLRAGAFMFD